MQDNPNKKEVKFRKLKKFCSYYRPHLPLFLADMFCATVIAWVDLAFPMVSRYALQNLLPNQAYRTFFLIVGALVLAYLLRTAMSYVVNYFGHYLGVRMEADMRKDLFSHLQRLPFKFYDSNRTGHLQSRVVGDLFEITELAHHGPEDVFISVLTLAGSFFLLLSINWQLTAILFVMIPIIIVFTCKARKNMARTSTKAKEKMAVINADIESSISGIRVAQAFGNEQYEVEKFTDGNAQYQDSRKGYYRAMSVFMCGMEFMTNILNVIVIAVGGYFIMKGHMDVVTLLTFTLYVNTFLQPIRKLANFAEIYSAGMAGFERMIALLDTQPDIIDKPDAKELKDVKGEIQFHDVSFSYDDDVNVLSGVNLKIKAGEKLALVGPSGGGKSTLCQLIPRFYEVVDGSITIDSQDIRDVTLSSLRGNIGIVQQDVFLFAGTIAENIRYGNLSATEEEIIRGRQAGGDPRFHHRPARWLRYLCGRAGHYALRRPKTAHLHRPHLPA